MDLSVIAPCFNEEGNVSELVTRLARVFGDDRLCERGGAEVVIVDDGSTDATWSEVTRMGSVHAFVVPVRHARNLGLAAAWRTGLGHARGRLVCILDADLQYRPEDILALYESLETSRADLAQGYRSLRGREGHARIWTLLQEQAMTEQRGARGSRWTRTRDGCTVHADTDEHVRLVVRTLGIEEAAWESTLDAYARMVNPGESLTARLHTLG